MPTVSERLKAIRHDTFLSKVVVFTESVGLKAPPTCRLRIFRQISFNRRDQEPDPVSRHRSNVVTATCLGGDMELNLLDFFRYTRWSCRSTICQLPPHRRVGFLKGGRGCSAEPKEFVGHSRSQESHRYSLRSHAALGLKTLRTKVESCSKLHMIGDRLSACGGSERFHDAEIGFVTEESH